MKIGRVNPTTLIVGAVVVAAAYIWLRGIKGFASDVAELTIKTAEGVVIGVGKIIGIPETEVDKCEALIAAGDWWNASFYCPAGTFLKSATGAIFDPETGEVVGYSEPGEAEIIEIEETPLLN
jgi:hypothetical protein